jgi:hypothetical protein
LDWGFHLGKRLHEHYEKNDNQPIIAYKYLKQEDLRFWLKANSIKIDTLSSYANIESKGGMGDPEEIEYKEITSFYVQDEHEDSLLEANLKTLIGDENFKSNCFFVSNSIQLPDKYVYCLSSKFDKATYSNWQRKEGYDCVVKIKDISKFLMEVQKSDMRGEQLLGAPVFADLVEYVRTPIDLEAVYIGDESKLGMLKDLHQFEWQSELRCIWRLPPSNQAVPYFLSIPNLCDLIEVMEIPNEWNGY